MLNQFDIDDEHSDRIAELNALISAGLGDLPQPKIARLTQEQRYNFRRRAHPRRLSRRPDYEAPEERRRKYLEEKAIDA